MRRAPSAGFSQGHRLVVVTEPETRRELARLAGEEEYVAMGMPPWISVAPVHVVVGVREASYHERYQQGGQAASTARRSPGRRRTGTSTPARSSCSSSSPRSPRASGAGVYGVPGEAVPALKELLGIPDDVHFVCIVTIGKQPPTAATARSSRG